MFKKGANGTMTTGVITADNGPNEPFCLILYQTGLGMKVEASTGRRNTK